MRLRYLAVLGLLALAGCSANGGPRPSSTNYIEPPAAPAGPIMPAPNLGLQPARMPHAGVAKRPARCPAGYRWVKAHRVPGPGGSSKKVPGGCR